MKTKQDYTVRAVRVIDIFLVAYKVLLWENHKYVC